jgi:hypothetical protein
MRCGTQRNRWILRANTEVWCDERDLKAGSAEELIASKCPSWLVEEENEARKRRAVAMVAIKRC